MKRGRDKQRVDQPDNDKGSLCGDAGAKGAAAEAKTILTAGSLYTGIVETINPDGTYHVTVPSAANTVSNVQNVSSMFAGIMGFRVNNLLPAGSEVVLAYGPPSFIVGVIPNGLPDTENGDNRKALQGDKTNPASVAGKEGGLSMAEDMLEGEFEITNMMGVAMTFLTTLIQMKAGDRAKVECLLLQDMVRIVADQYKLFSAMGEEHIYNDGRLSGETNHTSYTHEAYGLESEKSPIAELEKDEIDLDQEDRVDEIGRWRYTQFKGFIASFIHDFVTDPVATVGRMSDEGIRPGKSWVHRNNDGSLLLQSTAEIAIERVVRIPVPIRKKNHDDPDILKNREFSRLQTEALKLWDYGNTDGSQVYRTTYQLREYARWLSRLHSFARMIQMSDEFKIPTEAEGEDPQWHNQERDSISANTGGLTTYESYACIRIMRDGSIVNHDGYGSTVSLSNGNVQVSAARHLDLQAAGDIRIVAGQSIFMKARRHVEIVATIGSLIMKGKTALKALCEWGSVFIKSDARNPDEPGYTPQQPTDAGDPEPEVLKQAVMIDAPNGQFAVHSKHRAEIATTGSSFSDFSGDQDSVENTSAAVVLDSQASNVKTRAARHLMQVSAQTIGVRTNQWIWNAPIVYGDVQELDLNQRFTITPAGLTTQTINTAIVNATTIINGPQLGPTPIDPDNPVPGLVPHYGHVNIIDDDLELQFGENEDAINKRSEVSASSTQYLDIWEGSLPTFGFLSDDEYYWDVSEEESGVMLETLTQQHLRLDSPQYWGTDSFATWNWSSDVVTGIRIDTDRNRPFGVEAQQYQHNSGENLHKPSSTQASSFVNKASSWNVSSVSYKYLKRP